MKTNIGCKDLSNFKLWRAVRRLAMNTLVWVIGLSIGLTMLLVFLWQGVGVLGQSTEGIWRRPERIEEVLRLVRGVPRGTVMWQLDEATLRGALMQALPEGRGALKESPAVLSLPMPNGRFQRFRVVDSPVMAVALAAQHPQIKSYRGQGVDNPSLMMRCSLTPSGFSALVIDGAQTVMIQPLVWFRQAPPQRTDSMLATPSSNAPAAAGDAMYVSYYGRDYALAAEEAACLVKGDSVGFSAQGRTARTRRAATVENFSYGDTLRTYRIAFAVTPQFVSAVGAGNVMASLNNWLIAVNMVLEQELAVKLEMVSPVLYDNNGVSFSDPANPNYLTSLLDEVRSAFKSVNPSTYDLAHVLGIGSGGNAYVGGVCESLSENGGPYKAGGVTLLSSVNVVNQSDLVALLHEIGHQLGATHTFNVTSSSCTAGGRAGDTAFEPGSGVTIMSLGGTCGGDNVVTLREKRFHSGSLAQIIEFLDSYGGTCGTATPTGNAAPTVNAGADYIIPKMTPFTLTGTVKDPTGQALTYHWEQIDAGGAFSNPPYGDQTGDPVETTRPLFHSVAAMTPTAETAAQPFLSGMPTDFSLPQHLPGVSRALNFRLTARDSQSGGGGVGSDTMRLEVVGDAGPFAVTSPNTSLTWTPGNPQTITWSVNSTSSPPINCAKVNILFSADEGVTYGMLVRNTANDGAEMITVPNITTTKARIKVESIGNVFFDSSDTNFAVDEAAGCAHLLGSSEQNFASSGGTGSIGVLAESGCPWSVVDKPGWITINSGGSGSGPGTINYSVSANTVATRTGTITTAERTFTVTQDAAPSSGLQFYPLAAPVRLLDTRTGFTGCTTGIGVLAAGSTRTQPARTVCSTIPAAATAVIGNITVVPSGPGYLTLFPSDATQPVVVNSNFKMGEVTNNFFTVGLGAADGAFKIFTSAETQVIIDLTGYYAPPGTGGLYYHPLPSPVRLVETRAGQTGCFQPAQLQGTNNPNADPNLDLQVQGRGPGLPSGCSAIPNDAVVLVGNATTISPTTPLGYGYLTIYSSGAARPTVASSNYAGNDVINGPFAVKLGADGKFKIYTFSTTHLVVDISGYYSESATDANGAGLLFHSLLKPMRLLETRPDFSGFPLTGCSRPNEPVTGSPNIRTQQVWGTCSDQPLLTIPSSARAVVGNVTVLNAASAGFVAFFPGDIETAPTVATSNYPSTIGAYGYNRHYFVGLSPVEGTLKMLTQFTADLIVDVSGYFAP